MSLEKEVGEISGLREQSSDTKAEADEEVIKRIGTLRERILNGESTNDSISDFVIVAHHDISEEAEGPYRQVQRMLEDKKGEQILIVNEKIESGGRDGCFGGSRYTNVESTLRLGVLTSDIIFEIGDGEENFLMLNLPYSRANLTGPRIILPTERYAEKREGGFSPKMWELVEGNIEISRFEFHDFDPECEITMPHGIMSSKHGGSINYGHNLLIKAGIDVSDLFRSKRTLFKDDVSYVEALDLLGIKDQAPNDFVIRYNQEIGEAKGYIVKSLIGLLEQQGLSKSRITSIYDIAERGGVVSEGGAITPVESRDDAFWVSLRDRENSREAGKDIKRKLEAAVRLGMHKEELVLDGEIPGQSFDAQVLIRTLCEIYEVPYK